MCSSCATSRAASACSGTRTIPLPSLDETIDLNLRLGRRTNPAIRCAGVSLNTSQLEAGCRPRAAGAASSARLGLPVADPIRGGAEFEQLVDCLSGLSARANVIHSEH